MDVSSQEVGSEEGSKLIETVVSLTGMPEPLLPRVQEEVDHILAMSGQSSGSVTLEQLRIAMLAYLESMHAEFEKSEAAATSDSLVALDSFE